MKWLPSALVVLALTPATAAAQPAKAGAAVKIDFRALTEEGQLVADLKPEDVSLKVNGKQRQLLSLSLVQGSAGQPSDSTLPPPFSTNAAGRGNRNVHILIDDDSISPGRESQVKEAVRLLASEMAPGDRLGVLTTQGQLNMRPAEDLTKVRLAVDELTGHRPTTETDADAQCRTTRLLAAFGSMLALNSGAPTTIVIFSGGISPPAVKQLQLGARTRTAIGGSQASPNGVNDMCPIEPDTFSNIGMLASTAHADIYLFHLTEAMATRSSQLDAGFESLAGVSNAEFVRLTASPQAAISRLLRETAAYYTLSFDAEPGERGQSLRLEMHASRDKVRLRSRPSVAIPKGDVIKAGASPKDMLRTAAEYRDLPLRAAAYTSRMPGSDELRVVTLFEGVEAGGITAASVGLFDEKNTLKKQWTAQKDDLAKHPVRADLQAPPGVYRVRVAAVDAAGRSGHDRLRLECGDRARGSAEAERAGDRHAAAGCGVRPAAPVHQRPGGDRAARDLRRAEGRHGERGPRRRGDAAGRAARHRGHAAWHRERRGCASRDRRLQHREPSARRLPDAGDRDARRQARRQGGADAAQGAVASAFGRKLLISVCRPAAAWPRRGAWRRAPAPSSRLCTT